MFDYKLLDILCCPETRGKLRMADDALVGAINQAVAAGTLPVPTSFVKVFLSFWQMKRFCFPWRDKWLLLWIP